MTYHGGAPRVRRRKNTQTGAASENQDVGGIEIDSEILLNKVADAAISAGVAYIISRGT